MKSFTKFYVLMLAMLMSLGMFAQEMSLEMYQKLQQKAQLELQDHGPTVEVPMAPAGGRAALRQHVWIQAALPGFRPWCAGHRAGRCRVRPTTQTCRGRARRGRQGCA